ncbi:phage protein [Paucilactobacillus hokkaidonensis JCM 18461]|uniref:Phage protein n=1 Tax=Paucilactobacillus hokkaidonensis JCM 18461 TaxID=1291742 RepID=A0A0A1GYG7_9LACO|nr:hypothetical protein [Paucilactobacillus hokkaidonensis]BAP85516.1 phage protein [Paucilactobacillus hokkaidonensis JCM 18461]BAP85968.1 phage protein [Paucilactobacillus hokkaidonensis JCM 18461]
MGSRNSFQWLKTYLDNEEEIANIELNLRRTEIELSRYTDGDLRNIKLSKKSNASQLEEIICEHKKLLEQDYQIRNEVMALLDRFSGIENTILKEKYINGKTLMDIADMDDIGYSYQTIKRIHAELKRRLVWLDMWDIHEANDDQIKLF